MEGRATLGSASSDDRSKVELLALLALIGGAVAIGFAPVLARVSEAGPVSTAFFRMALSVPLLWAWWWANESPRRTTGGTAPWRPNQHLAKRPPKHLLWLSGLFFAIDLSIWHWAIHFTTVANATLFANVAPVFVTIGAWMFWDERVDHVFITGSILAFLGAVILVGIDVELGRWFLIGDAMSLAAAVFYAAYILTVKELRRHYSVARIMAVSAFSSSVILLPMALISPGESLLPATAMGWLILVALALVSHVAGQSLIAYALAHLQAGLSAITLLVQPVVAAALAWWWVDERLSTLQILGGLLVLAGIFVARQGTKANVVTGLGRRPPPPRTKGAREHGQAPRGATKPWRPS